MKMSGVERAGTSRLRRTERSRAKAHSPAAYRLQRQASLTVGERVPVPRRATAGILYMVALQAARLSKRTVRRAITRREVRSALQLLRPGTHAAHQGA